MANNVYGSGRKNVGSYQVAGKSYVTASTISSGEELDLQLPNISNNITVKLDSAGGGAGTKATGSVTAAYPTASASPTYNASGTLESNHHGDTFALDGTTFTVNYEGTGSFGTNEIKTYEQTGSGVYFGGQSNAGFGQLVGLKAAGYNTRLDQGNTNGMSFSLWFNRKADSHDGKFSTLLAYNSGDLNPNEYSFWISLIDSTETPGDTVKVFTLARKGVSGGASATTQGSSGDINDNEYNHLVVTFASASSTATNGCTVYLNGAQVAQGNSNAHLYATASTDLYIGDGVVDPSTAQHSLNGVIQNVCAWQGVLSLADANTLYNSGSVKDPTIGSYSATLKDWWRLDSGSTGFQSAGDTPATQYLSNNSIAMNAMANFATFNSVAVGVPFERHTQSEFYTAVTTAFNTTSKFGTFNVATPNANSSLISITASNAGTGSNGQITHSANETFTAAVDTAGGTDAGGGGGGSLRVHFRSTGSLPNVANNRHYWELSSASEKIEMNVKTKEIYLSADGGDCDFSLQADLTNISISSMYQHTGSGVDE